MSKDKFNFKRDFKLTDYDEFYNSSSVRSRKPIKKKTRRPNDDDVKFAKWQ